uniref:Uncharacterized protein n=1 Tax=Bactrocera latifrons TaxID=174628 RepID=A0A0K8W7R4_BACLA
MSSNEVSGTDQAPTLSYMLFLHRHKLRSRAKQFAKELSLTQSKLYITDTLISDTKKQLYQHRGLNNVGILNRERLFCNYLKRKINKMLAWKEMSSEQRMQMKQAALVIRKAMESQSNEEENSAKRQKLDDGSVFMKTEKVQLSKLDHSC